MYPFYINSLIDQFALNNYINKYSRERFDNNFIKLIEKYERKDEIRINIVKDQNDIYELSSKLKAYIISKLNEDTSNKVYNFIIENTYEENTDNTEDKKEEYIENNIIQENNNVIEEKIEKEDVTYKIDDYNPMVKSIKWNKVLKKFETKIYENIDSFETDEEWSQYRVSNKDKFTAR